MPIKNKDDFLIPTRSEKAHNNKDILFYSLNDIDIYVEDTAQETKKFYTLIFRKIFMGKYNIATIFQAGDKDKLLTKYNEVKDEKTDRTRLFITDGDLDLFYPRELNDFNELHYLKRYCIENYLVEEDALLELLTEESTTILQEEAKDLLKFSEWLQANQKQLTELFKLYAICHKHGLGIRLTKGTVFNLRKDSSGCVCPTATEKRMQEIKEALEKKDISIEDELKTINEHLCTDKCITHTVTAKDYLLPLIKERLEMFTERQLKNNLFKIKLASLCSLEELKKELSNY